jgi:hypothetical protein
LIRACSEVRLVDDVFRVTELVVDVELELDELELDCDELEIALELITELETIEADDKTRLDEATEEEDDLDELMLSVDLDVEGVVWEGFCLPVKLWLRR